MRMCGRQGGKESQSLRKPLGRLEGLPRFVLNALLISLVVLSIPGLLTANKRSSSRLLLSNRQSTSRWKRTRNTKRRSLTHVLLQLT